MAALCDFHLVKAKQEFVKKLEHVIQKWFS